MTRLADRSANVEAFAAKVQRRLENHTPSRPDGDWPAELICEDDQGDWIRFPIGPTATEEQKRVAQLRLAFIVSCGDARFAALVCVAWMSKRWDVRPSMSLDRQEALIVLYASRDALPRDSVSHITRNQGARPALQAWASSKGVEGRWPNALRLGYQYAKLSQENPDLYPSARLRTREALQQHLHILAGMLDTAARLLPLAAA